MDDLRKKQSDHDPSVEALLRQYEVVKVANQEIDDLFVFPEGDRPDVPFDKFDNQLPIIDLSPVSKLQKLRKEIAASEGASSDVKLSIQEEIDACEGAKAALLKGIRAACEDNGFFQIVNHDFPMELAEQFSDSCRQLFDLPLEDKMKCHSKISPNFGMAGGYSAMMRGNAFREHVHSKIWNEAFDVHRPELDSPGKTEAQIRTLWPEPESSGKGQQFISRAEEYMKQAKRLCLILLDLMVSSLGLPEGSLQDLLGYTQEPQMFAALRINHYPVCPRPELTLGLHGHTDPNILTLLYQDAVGGLQIRSKDGTWHGVQPIPGAFVVNVADHLQAWTNGRFNSVEHRVVANEKSRRVSMAYVVRSELDSPLRPRQELVDAEHPLRYKPFTLREYGKAIFEHGVNAERKTHVLDRVFGIETKT